MNTSDTRIARPSLVTRASVAPSLTVYRCGLRGSFALLEIEFVSIVAVWMGRARPWQGVWHPSQRNRRMEPTMMRMRRFPSNHVDSNRMPEMISIMHFPVSRAT